MTGDPSLQLSTMVALVGLVSGLLGAVGAGVGVYVSMRLESANIRHSAELAIAQLRGELEKVAAVVDTRLKDLEHEVAGVSRWAKANTKT